ncbi:MAG: class I SAM-dependent methyltransferase [Gammaproteobacteria bacterium]|nr:class I SAM-dependent methyltransferase [Gammaproteobacteria bacterium]
MTRCRFDKAYYDHFYRNPLTRAVSPAAVKRQAAFIAAYLKHLQIPIASIVDIGCGVGTLLRALQHAFPRARCQGVEYSDYLCERYGWKRGSVETYEATTAYDLVVCNDVLPYLDDQTCTKALDNLGRLSRGALYCGALTHEDLEHCDPDRTDLQQHVRPSTWYRERLAKEFMNVGGGLFLKQPVEVTVWALDRA